MFVVEEAEGWEDAAAWLPLPPKEPLLDRDSAARESEVMVPADSTLGCDVPWGSLVTCEGVELEVYLVTDVLRELREKCTFVP